MQIVTGMRGKIVMFPLLILCVATAEAEESSRIASLGHVSRQTHECRCNRPKIKESVEYYEITGTCENDLRRQMKQNGNIRVAGGKYDALTDWELKWDYGYNNGKGSCSVDSFSVDVNIVYRYPKWITAENAPPELVTKWRAYLQSLMDHESLHSYQVVQAADELTHAVSMLPPAATCEELDRAVRCLCDEKVKQLQDDQERYDRVSGHGAAQGAVFP
ncbi:MAG: DUF922 domain-containing Zn-dependent protease [Nitrospirota bacterium]|nr:DUF922 domain-containing Zn-dependent protease [Nitrospirota bacterium]